MHATVDFKKAFDRVEIGRLHTSMAECTEQRAEVDILVRGHFAVPCRIEMEGIDVPGIVDTTGIQQGAGSSTTLFVTLVERLP